MADLLENIDPKQLQSMLEILKKRQEEQSSQRSKSTTAEHPNHTRTPSELLNKKGKNKKATVGQADFLVSPNNHFRCQFHFTALAI